MYLVVRMARFFCLYIYIYVSSGVHLHLRMREIISRKMVQRSPFWRLASERQQGVFNTTGRFAELANNVKHSSSIVYGHPSPPGSGCCTVRCMMVPELLMRDTMSLWSMQDTSCPFTASSSSFMYRSWQVSAGLPGTRRPTHEREREREIEGGRERERQRGRGRERERERKGWGYSD